MTAVISWGLCIWELSDQSTGQYWIIHNMYVVHVFFPKREWKVFREIICSFHDLFWCISSGYFIIKFIIGQIHTTFQSRGWHKIISALNDYIFIFESKNCRFPQKRHFHWKMFLFCETALFFLDVNNSDNFPLIFSA